MTPTLDILASGSKANCYVLKAGQDHLIIEAGVKPSEIIQHIDFKTDRFIMCLCSHKHQDHFKYAKQLHDDYCISVYTNPDAVTNFGYPMKAKYKYHIIGTDWKVMPLPVPHGDFPNYAYVIDHPDTGRIVFATDCEDFPYDIKDVTTLMIEANYSEEILLNKALDGEDIRSHSETHMEINRAISVIERLQSPKLRRVVLLHLSDGFSDERAFISRVREVVGDMVEVYAADKGMSLSLEKDWF